MVTNKEENATCSSENSHAVGESIKSKPSADEDDVCDATSSVIISRDYSEGSNIERSDQIPQNQAIIITIHHCSYYSYCPLSKSAKKFSLCLTFQIVH